MYDHFHLVKAMNDRLDKVRRRTMNRLDADLKKILKGQRFTLTKNEEDLSEKESAHLREMRSTFSELSDVHALKERLRGIYSFAQYEYGARLLLEDWCTTARLTKVPELESMARTIEDHIGGHPRLLEARQGVQLRGGGVQQQGPLACEAGLRPQGSLTPM